MRTVLKVTILMGLILLASNGLGGCKGGKVAQVGNIEGPDWIWETASGDYKIHYNGTNPTFLWSCNPQDAGFFEDPESEMTTFIARETSDDITIELRVLIDSDQWTPVLQTKEITIRAKSPFAWAGAWGDYSHDKGHDVAVDDTGNAYVVGEFRGTVDFWPGPGEAIRSSAGSTDAFLSKYDTMGDLLWVRTWGGHYGESGNSVAVDLSFNIYVTGYFRYSADFHPDPWEEDIHLAMGFTDDIFLSKYDSNGNYIGTNTWGGDGKDLGKSVAVDSNGNPYVIGEFMNTVDFNPDPLEDDIHSANGPYEDIFLSHFSSSGDYKWTRTWGGTKYERVHGIGVSPSGNAYVTGWFIETVDFDPGPGIDEHTSNDAWDAFLTVFKPDGSHSWTYTWGGLGNDYGSDVCFDSDANLYVIGSFNNEVDFDPGPGIEIIDSFGANDAFISSFDKSGGYRWTQTWGDFQYDDGQSIVTDSYGKIFATGKFANELHFTLNPDGYSYISDNIANAYICVFKPDGTPIWAGSWGFTSGESDNSIALDPFGDIFLSGYFEQTADLNPGPGVESHTTNGMEDVFLIKLEQEGIF